MKSKIKILAICLALLVFSVIFARQISAQQSEVSFQVFYDQLSPYGQWVDYPNYGYVWIPDAGSDFVPYSTGGHWIITDYGMTWISDYNWGWAPFHYGRWDYNDSYGWFWIPDNEWGPAWVSWRRASGYYGWEPMGPGISISMSFGREYDSHNDHWIFVQDRYIDRSDMNRFYANRVDHDRIVRNSTIINNTYIDKGRHTTYVAGPAREDIQKSTGRRVNPVTVQENNKPGQEINNGQLRIYRPQVMTSNDKQQKPAPSKITNVKDVKRHDWFESVMKEATQAEAKGDRTGALADYNEAVQILPDSTEAKQGKARLEAVAKFMMEGARAEARKDWDNALVAYQNAWQRIPDAGDIKEAVERVKEKVIATRQQKALEDQRSQAEAERKAREAGSPPIISFPNPFPKKFPWP